jgi:hypothetical protein
VSEVGGIGSDQVMGFTIASGSISPHYRDGTNDEMHAGKN